MAIKVAPQVLDKNDKVELSLEEFNRWLMKFDVNGDGKLSTEELQEAIRATGGSFSKMKANRIMKAIDTNFNGYIDGSEISKLVAFAPQFGLKVVSFQIDHHKTESRVNTDGVWFKFENM